METRRRGCPLIAGSCCAKDDRGEARPISYSRRQVLLTITTTFRAVNSIAPSACSITPAAWLVQVLLPCLGHGRRDLMVGLCTPCSHGTPAPTCACRRVQLLMQGAHTLGPIGAQTHHPHRNTNRWQRPLLLNRLVQTTHEHQTLVPQAQPRAARQYAWLHVCLLPHRSTLGPCPRAPCKHCKCGAAT